MSERIAIECRAHRVRDLSLEVLALIDKHIQGGSAADPADTVARRLEVIAVSRIAQLITGSQVDFEAFERAQIDEVARACLPAVVVELARRGSKL